MTISKNIEEFLLSEVAGDYGMKSIDSDADLLDQRIIDSLGILKLVSFLEETYSIKVMDEDVVPENFQSLNSMVKFVELKMKNK